MCSIVIIPTYKRQLETMTNLVDIKQLYKSLYDSLQFDYKFVFVFLISFSAVRLYIQFHVDILGISLSFMNIFSFAMADEDYSW